MAAISLFGDTNIVAVSSVTHHSLRLFPVRSAHDPPSFVLRGTLDQSLRRGYLFGVILFLGKCFVLSPSNEKEARKVYNPVKGITIFVWKYKCKPISFALFYIR